MPTLCLPISEVTDPADENQAFQKWKGLPDGAMKEQALMELVPLLRKHASSLVWLILHEQKLEVVDDAIWIVLSKSDKFRGESKFTTWFHRVVATLCYQVMREKRRRNEVSLEVLPEVGHETDLSAKMVLKQLSSVLRRRHRLLVALKLENMTNKAIGEVMGISEAAVKMMWIRVKDKLESYGAEID